MITKLFSTKAIEQAIPKEIKEKYTIVQLMTINRHNAIFTLESKFSNKRYILKVLDKEYYNKSLYQKLFSLTNSCLLLPTGFACDNLYIYTIYPQMLPLNEAVSTKKITYPMIRTFISDIGLAISTLHSHGIIHLDIAPNNIFIDDNGHFYLGDFSSAQFASIKSILFHKDFKRTGSTPTFAVPAKVQSASFSYWNDLYSFTLLIYVLCNNGRFPNDKNNTISTFDSLLVYLDKTMEKPCSIHPNIVKDFLKKIENLLSLCDKDKTCTDYILNISEEKLHTFSESTIENTSTNSSKLTLRESAAFLHKFPVSPSSCLYGILFVCGFIFLFSLYHYLSQNKNNNATSVASINQLYQDTIDTPEIKEPSITQNPASVPKIQESPITQNVTNTPEIQRPSITQNATNTPEIKEPSITQNLKNSQNYSKQQNTSEKLNFLNLSDKKYNNSSLKKQLSHISSLSILAANNCKLTSCKEFSKLTELKELYLYNNQITSLKELSNLSNLKILVLSKNRITNLAILSKLTSLTTLDLSHNYQLKHISSLASIKTLQSLILTNTNITQKEITILQQKLPHCTIYY